MQAGAARQWACQQLLVRFFRLLDEKCYDEVAALFDAQGIWRRPGSVLTGRGEILASLRLRPAQRHTRHIVGNFLVVADGGGRVDASAMLTTFAAEGVGAAASPALGESLVGLFSAKAAFACDGGAPMLIELELAPDLVFARATPAGRAPVR